MTAQLLVQCWCGRQDRMVPVEWLSEGRTASCSPECTEGCAYVGDTDAFDCHFAEPATAGRNRRILMHDYDPGTDSSPGTEHVQASYPGHLVLVNDGGCECGCGGVRAARSKFLPGHDARLKGKLQRAMASEVGVALVGPDGEVHFTDPDGVARHYGWYDKVRSGADRIVARSSTPLAAEKRLAAEVETRPEGLVEFGRWDRTGRAMAAWKLLDGSLEVKYVTSDGKIEVMTR